MTPIQFAVLTLWAFFALGAIIHVNTESALLARNVGHTTKLRPLGLLEIMSAIFFAGTGALIWWWIV